MRIVLGGKQREEDIGNKFAQGTEIKKTLSGDIVLVGVALVFLSSLSGWTLGVPSVSLERETSTGIATKNERTFAIDKPDWLIFVANLNFNNGLA